MKKTIDQYNKTDTLLVISLYPKHGELYSTGTSGVASYTKNVVTNLDRKVVVLANYEKKPASYEENNALVIRCFKFNTIRMWLDILHVLKHFTKTKEILLQFDFAVYGGIVTGALVIPFLMVLMLLGYRTSIVIHHVVTDIRKLSGHVGLGMGRIDSIKAFFYNQLFHVFYLALNLMATRIIVLEETLKTKLESIIGEGKIAAIPHGVDTSLKPMNKKKARKTLGINEDEQVILFFGFINWFKGADIFAKTYSDQSVVLGKKARYIIAGGISPTLENKGYYRTYFANVMQTVNASKTVRVEGYIPQEKICAYFSSADLVVFPYRHFMTASGVLSLVFSYKKPFIVSRPLGEMFCSLTLTESLEIANLHEKDFIFDLNKDSCISLTRNVLRNGIKVKMRKFTKIVREERSYKNTALLFDEAIFSANAFAVNKKVALGYNYKGVYSK